MTQLYSKIILSMRINYDYLVVLNNEEEKEGFIEDEYMPVNSYNNISDGGVTRVNFVCI